MHWLSQKLEARTRPDGQRGIFATEPVEPGALLTVWGGPVYHADFVHSLPEVTRVHCLQVEDDLFLLPPDPHEDADFFNHACAPNAGMSGATALVAMREIADGEEVCYDYAMTDSSPYDEFRCRCGSELCRTWVRGTDWRLPELQRRYAGYFSSYLQRRIDALRSQR
ncbi:MAG: SET domain-containing protein-lysine N-methyltransferase [Deltaproteobacteria bacterium]|nr:SET domain-containing protein-lysine N-methyltransferase [Deltaproteobacteria bacterium]